MKKCLFCILFLFCVFFVSCASLGRSVLDRAFQAPTARLDRVGVKGLSMEKAVLTTVLVISNPNPYPLKTSRMTCSLFVDSTNFSLVTVVLTNSVHLRARQTNAVSLDVTLRFDALPLKVLRATNIPFLIEGEVVVDSLIGPLRFPFRHKASVPAPRTPVFRLVKLGLTSLSLTGLKAGFEMIVSVSNRNPYSLPLKDLNMDLNLNGRPVLKSGTSDESGRLSIGPYQARPVRLAFQADLSGLKELAAALTSGRRVEFGLKGSYQPDMDHPPSLPYDFIEKGISPVVR